MIDMNSDLNRKIHNRINRNNRRNRRNRMIVLTCLLVSLITGTVMSSPATAMTDDTETQADKGADEVASAEEDGSSDEMNGGSESSGDEDQNSSNGEENSSDSVQNSSDGNNDSSDGQNGEMLSFADEQAGGSSSAQQESDDASRQSGDSSNAGQDNSAAGMDAVLNPSAADTAATGLTDPAAAANTAEIAETADTEEEAEEKEGEKELTAESDDYKVSAVRTDDERFPYGAQLEVKSLSDDERQSASALIADDLKKENTDKSDVSYKEASGLSDAARNVVSAVKGVVTGSEGNVSDASAAQDGKQLVSKTTTSTITTYKIAGIVGIDLSAVFQGMEDGDDHADGDAVEIDSDVDYTAEFRNDPDFAGFAKKEEKKDDKASTDSDGNQVTTSSTKTTETSWRLYRLESDDKGSDGDAEDGIKDVSDITKDDHTDLTTDSDSHLQKASFRSSLSGQFAAVQVEKITEVTRTVTDYAQEEKISMPAVAFNKKADTAAGKVTVSVDAPDGAFPEGTTMQVKPVTTDSVLDKAVDAAGGRGEAVAVDISFRAADGNEIEPQKKISVRMTSDVIGTAKTAHAVHIDDKGDASVVAKKSGDGTKKNDTGSASSSAHDENGSGEDEGNNVLSFTSKSFSVYAIVYTVDFSFSGYTYSIKGESSIMLSDLAKKLKLHDDEQDKDFAIDDVDSVTFSDESLVKVTKKDGDWELTSLKPFKTNEKLTINMKDGSRYEVAVKDADANEKTQDITKNLTDATIKINGQEVTGNETWNVKADNSYDITLTFKENSSSQFPNDDTWMTYKVPEGLTVESFDTTFDMIVAGKKISGNKLVVDKSTGLIKLQWNMTDTNISTLTDSNNLSVDVNIKASFDSSKKEIIFSDNVKREVDVDTKHNASVDKTGWYDNSDGKIHYIVTVTSSGTSKDVVVTDNINGTALTYDNNVKYESTKGATAKAEKKDNGFTATIPSMSDGEQVKFTYTATVDFDKLKESGTVQQQETSNGVKIECPGDSDDKDNSKEFYVNYISYSSIGKNAQSVSDTFTEDGKIYYRTITWNLKANEERKKSLTYISDSIAKDSQSIMTYSGDGLTIVVTKEDGTTETRNVKWTDSSITKTDTGWTYNPPKSDGKASYNVTYTTKADVTNLSSNMNVINNAYTDHNSTTGNASVGPAKTGETISASKVATRVSEDDVQWTITINVPAKGYDQLVVTDTLPHRWLNKYSGYSSEHEYRDTFGELKSITGLDDNESYVIDTASDPTKFTLTFYKDKSQTKEGVNSSTGNRTITIRYTTKNNKDWMQCTADHPYDSWVAEHENTAEITAQEIKTTVKGSAFPSKMTIKKYGSLSTKNVNNQDKNGTHVDSDGTVWKILEYNIVLSGITDDDQIVTDTFDTKHLQYFDGAYNYWTDDSAGVIYGGSPGTPDAQSSGMKKITVTPTKDGLEFNTGKLPRQNDGSLYGYYRIHYYLKVKLSDLQQLAVKSDKNDGTAKITNSVQWGTEGSSVDVYYPYPGVTKSCVPQGDTAYYTISVNPSALELNSGNAMQLEDTYENQMIDYSTITVFAYDATGKIDRSKEVTYAPAEGGKLIFTIPDSTSVLIKYQAKPVGKAGSKVTMTNQAVMKAYHSKTSQDMTIGGRASGTGDVAELKLLKYAKDHMETKLSGAVFELLDEKGNVLKYDTGSNKGKEITFTTDSNGYVEIKAVNSTGYSKGLAFGTTYKLREIKAPDSYQLADGDIPFTISEDGSSDLSKNQYANGSTIAVADKEIGKTYELPDTGGPGIKQWQEMGMFLLLAGAVLISGKLLASEKKERGGEL